MSKSGMYMLRRIFPSPLTIASFSLEPHLTRWGMKTMSSNPGKEVCPETAKSALPGIFLARLDGNVVDLRSFLILGAFSSRI